MSDDITIRGVWALAFATVGRFAHGLFSHSSLSRKLDELHARLEGVESHVESINRKQWRRDHPDAPDTPMPFEPRTYHNLEVPVLKGRRSK